MVDATQFGTVCLQIRDTKERDYLFDALSSQGDGLVLAKDLNLNLEFIDEGKSLVLIDEKMVNNQAEARAAFATREPGADGKYEKPVKIAFCNMSAMNGTVASISQKLKDDDTKKKEKEAAEAEKEADERESEELSAISEKLSYKLKGQTWVEPEFTGQDCRKGDARFVAGGSPQALGTDADAVIKAKTKDKPLKEISRYMTGGPDRLGNFKVYIEEPAVVNCAIRQIKIEFLNTSYSVRAETPSQRLVLGPVKCGQLNTSACSWKLSAGKRLTVSLVKGAGEGVGALPPRQPRQAPARYTSNEGESGLGLLSWGMVVPMFVVALAVVAMQILGKIQG